MLKESVGLFLVRVSACFRESWGAPFVLGYMLLLAVAAVVSTVGADPVASEVAVYAYYSLVLGVVLQLACFVKQGRRKGAS